MGLVSNLDDYIIDHVTQPCVNFIVNHGKSKAFAIDICLIVATATMIFSASKSELKAGLMNTSSIASLCICVLFFLLQNWRCKQIIKTTSSSNTMPRARIEFKAGRHFCIVIFFVSFIIFVIPTALTLPTFYNIFSHIMSIVSPLIGVALPIFIISCRDLPPRKKIKYYSLAYNSVPQA